MRSQAALVALDTASQLMVLRVLPESSQASDWFHRDGEPAHHVLQYLHRRSSEREFSNNY